MPLASELLAATLIDCDWTPYTDISAGTLGTPVKLPTAQSFSVTPAFDTINVAYLGKSVETTTNKRITIAGSVAGYPLETLQALYGGTLTTTGSTPNQIKKYEIGPNDNPTMGRLRGRQILPGAGAQDVMVEVHGVTMTGVPNITAGAEYSTTPISGTSSGHPATGKFFSISNRETGAALS